MEKAYGPEGANLYEMLWKYRADSLRAEDAAQLVDYLDHDQLAFRVLGLWNLKNITGLTLTYRPEDPRSRRQSAIQRWRDRLRSVPTLRGKGAAPGEKPGPPPVEATPATEPAGEGQRPAWDESLEDGNGRGSRPRRQN
jgi:hypothetical protein